LAFRRDRGRASRPASAEFPGEDIARGRLDRGNKSTVNRPPDDERVAIFPALSTPQAQGTISPPGAAIAEHWFRRSAEGICEMRQLRSLLRTTPSRVRRRLAEIVAIAAASLPAAGV